MNFDPKTTERMKAFLEADQKDRDYREALDIILRLSGNIYWHRMVSLKGPENFAPVIEKRIRDYYQFRLRKVTHEQVREMSHKADAAVAEIPVLQEEIKTGKRPDHDYLPDNIKAAYIETLDCLNKMRELHLQIRTLALHRAACPDSEIYPFVKEIIKLDNRRLQCWKLYDTYKIQQDGTAR